jgi:hypothetical protein
MVRVAFLQSPINKVPVVVSFRGGVVATALPVLVVAVKHILMFSLDDWYSVFATLPGRSAGNVMPASIAYAPGVARACGIAGLDSRSCCAGYAGIYGIKRQQSGHYAAVIFLKLQDIKFIAR